MIEIDLRPRQSEDLASPARVVSEDGNWLEGPPRLHYGLKFRKLEEADARVPHPDLRKRRAGGQPPLLHRQGERASQECQLVLHGSWRCFLLPLNGVDLEPGGGHIEGTDSAEVVAKVVKGGLKSAERAPSRQLVTPLNPFLQILERQPSSFRPDEPAGRVLSLPALQECRGVAPLAALRRFAVTLATNVVVDPPRLEPALRVLRVTGLVDGCRPPWSRFAMACSSG